MKGMKKCRYDAEKIEVDYETLKRCLGIGVSAKISSINRAMHKMQNAHDDTHSLAFTAEHLVDDAEALKYMSDLYHAVCEAPSRDTFTISGMKEGE